MISKYSKDGIFGTVWKEETLSYDWRKKVDDPDYIVLALFWKRKKSIL